VAVLFAFTGFNATVLRKITNELASMSALLTANYEENMAAMRAVQFGKRDLLILLKKCSPCGFKAPPPIFRHVM